MKKFWKEHAGLRLLLMALFFLSGLALVIVGWKMTGELLGLGLMCMGVLLILIALAIYNSPYGD